MTPVQRARKLYDVYAFDENGARVKIQLDCTNLNCWHSPSRKGRGLIKALKSAVKKGTNSVKKVVKKHAPTVDQLKKFGAQVAVMTALGGTAGTVGYVAAAKNQAKTVAVREGMNYWDGKAKKEVEKVIGNDLTEEMMNDPRVQDRVNRMRGETVFENDELWRVGEYAKPEREGRGGGNFPMATTSAMKRRNMLLEASARAREQREQEVKKAAEVFAQHRAKMPRARRNQAVRDARSRQYLQSDQKVRPAPVTAQTAKAVKARWFGNMKKAGLNMM